MFSKHPNKKSFLSFDFYAQAAFTGVAVVLAILSIFDTLFMAFGLWLVVPVAIYNSVGLLIHIFMGSYSKNIVLLRIVHAILGFSSIVGLLFYIKDNLIDEGLVFYVISAIPFVFLLSYFLITWQDFKAMKKNHNHLKSK
ncbi:hypothetical protein V9L05_16260 [Bernardetia sp. Wsw4-3y2]|uniref:hypothetical protein n=1 Tax=unclassified Bernardetia TaxID=2647129 RepID=UPI0030D02ADF